MPSVEIVCVDQDTTYKPKSLPFAVRSEENLVSHRVPTPMWQANFDKLSGCIYHLGGPRKKLRSARDTFTAFELLEVRNDNRLIFRPRYVPALKRFFEQLLDRSPAQRIIFTSDYQFAGKPRQYKRPLLLNRFWEKHSRGELRLNAWYELRVAKR